MAAQPRKKLLWYLSAAALVSAALILFFIKANTSPVVLARVAAPESSPLAVSSLGRIEPEDATVIIGARSLSGQPSLLRQLNVKEGDHVKAGQVIAILDSLPQLEAALRQAEAQVGIADAQLKQAKEGAKSADIAAQQAEIARLEVELSKATKTYSRTEDLFKKDIVSESSLEQDQLPVESIKQQIVEAKERLQGLGEVRQVDVDVAAADLRAAQTDVQRAKVEAEAAVIRAPYSGSVLKIHTWQGEEVGPHGILELARVDHMYVIAEVAESDIQRVKVGQRAKISGYSLPKPIEGTVEQVGLKVSRNSLVVDNPVNLTDARIIEIKIRLDDGSKVQNLIDAQVDVLINP